MGWDRVAALRQVSEAMQAVTVVAAPLCRDFGPEPLDDATPLHPSPPGVWHSLSGDSGVNGLRVPIRVSSIQVMSHQ